MHRKLRRSRWDRQHADSPSFLRSRSCSYRIGLAEFHRRNCFPFPHTGSAIKDMFVSTSFNPRKFGTYFGGATALRLIDKRRSEKTHILGNLCGKRVQINSRPTTDFLQACQTTQGVNEDSIQEKSRKPLQRSSFPCFSRVANQQQQLPLSRRF